MWMAIHGGVYDVTNFHARHPGGIVISEYAGQDATDQFELFHNPTVAAYLRPFLVGHLADSPAAKVVGATASGVRGAASSVAHALELSPVIVPAECRHDRLEDEDSGNTPGNSERERV